ncbi:DUF4232 domain-containing protein [Streptomyces sp. NPDC006296]|uniref:DUF4232 domain-containing protein n=1 Tax=Streptomyces sp. NPDC006296 TaxID=3156746 RepID=UPI0033B5309C
MHTKKLSLTALALVAGLSLTACQGSENSAAGTSDSETTASSSSSSGADDSTDSTGSTGGDASEGGTTGSGEESPTSDADQGSGEGKITTGGCRTANLDFSTTHGMGEGDLVVRLKNTGDACTLKGFPGVDLRSQDASGPISAARTEATAPVVNLGTGETTRFTLHYPPNNSGGSGVHVSAIEVTPPDETHSKALSVSLRMPVTEGADQKVTVDPVGYGKQ